MKKIAALLYENDAGHLDHLAPFCALNDFPLFLTSKELYKAAISQYENLQIILDTPISVCSNIAKNYDTLVSTLPIQLLKPMFLLEQALLNKNLTFYWLPHGSSGKKNMSALKEEEHLLVYGNKMKKSLPADVQDKTQFIGNFRQKYFLLHQKFYKNLVAKHFSFSDKNILYAPSWEEENIERWIASLIAHKKESMHLFIKLHPNTYLKNGGVLHEKFAASKGVFFIKNFFPIYPLLDHVDHLFTDISSIGYDFLSFDKPLSFTTKNDDMLHKCGKEVEIDDPYIPFEKEHYSTNRKELYAETFSINCTTKLQGW